MASQPTLTSPRLLFYTLYMAYIAAGIITILPGPTLSLLAARTYVSLAQASWAFTIFSTGFALGVVIAGTLGKWVSPKALLLLGLALMGGTGLITPFTHSFPLLLASQCTKGIGFGFLDVSINILATLVFNEKLSETLNRLHSSFGVGSLLAPLLLSLTLTAAHDFTWAFLSGSIACAVCFAMLLYQRTPTILPSSATAPGDGKGQPVERTRRMGPGIFGQILLWLMALEFFLYIASEVGFSSWIVTAVSQSAAITLALAAPAATAFWLGLTASRLLGAQVLKRMLLSEKQLLYVCIVGGTICGLLVAFFSGQVIIAFAASTCFGFFLGPLFPGMMSIASRWFVHNLNTISGVVFVACGVSGMIFPVVMGLLFTSPGIPWAMSIPALGCLLIAAPLYLANRKQRVTLQLRQQEHTIEDTTHLSSIG